MANEPITLEAAVRRSHKMLVYRRYGLGPLELNPTVQELHRSLHVAHNAELNVYTIPDAPTIAFGYKHDDLLWIELGILKLNETGQTYSVKRENQLKTHVELLLPKMVEWGGYNMDSLLRKIKLRALLT